MITFEPGQTKKYILKQYQNVDAAPAFLFRSLSAREAIEPRETLSYLVEKGNAESAADLDRICGSIGNALVGWENVGIDFDITKLADICEMNELYELLGVVAFGGITADDKKK